MSETKLPTRVKCPTCRKEILYDTKSSFKPFCSERCRLIDLGEWASETFKVPVSNQNPMDEHELDIDSELLPAAEDED